MEDPTLDIHSAVTTRYAAAARAREESLCCPVPYDPALLAVIPEDVIARDYGCGDPARYVRPGETVLDLGSGGGKHCFMAAQVVGPTGRVIGVDTNDAMLALARSAAPVVAERVGYANVEFRRGRIEDLAVCEKTFQILTSGPYAGHVEAIHPRVLPSPEESRPFPCNVGALVRHPRETKGEDYQLTTEAAACGPDGSCCG